MKQIFKRCFLLAVLYSCTMIVVQGQVKTIKSYRERQPVQIEINPYIRQDAYPKFLASVRTLSSDYVTLKGRSHGINLNIKKRLLSNINY